eukprot:ANDGO_02590.mRNA.1 hypothetical protein
MRNELAVQLHEALAEPVDLPAREVGEDGDGRGPDVHQAAEEDGHVVEIAAEVDLLDGHGRCGDLHGVWHWVAGMYGS